MKFAAVVAAVLIVSAIGANFLLPDPGYVAMQEWLVKAGIPERKQRKAANV